MINKVKMFLEDNKIELYYIMLLTATLLVIGIPRLYTQLSVGIGNWDTYLYLENGRSFAQMGWGDVASISPVVPYILSLFFRIALHPYQEAIFYLSLMSYIIGTISLYLLFRFKFDNKTSYVGCIIYATFTLLYSWVAIGGNDITGVSLTLLAIYLIVLAHNKNNKYYCLALPAAAYAFLSRYTAGVMIFAIFFYLAINKITKEEFKKFIAGGAIGAISVSPFLYNFYRVLHTPFPFLGQFSGTVSNTKVLDAGYLPDIMYYINHVPNYLNSYMPPNANFNNVVNPMGNIPGAASYILMALFLMGILLTFAGIYKSVKNSNITFNTRNNKLNLIILAMLLILCISSIGNASYIVTTVLMLSVLFIIHHMFDSYGIKYLDYDLLMLGLFLIYLIFQSILSTKNDRYFITALPFIAYFITNTIYHIYNYIDRHAQLKQVKLSTVVSCAIVILFVANSLYYNSTIPQENPYKDIEDACAWFGSNCEYGNQTVVYSDNWPAVTWYLNIYARRGVPDTDNENISWNYTKDILSSSTNHTPASFYIDTNNPKKIDYAGLEKIKKFNNVEIYENAFLKDNNQSNLQSDSYMDYYNNIFNRYSGL